MAGFSTLLSLLGLLTGVGGSIAGSEEQEKAERKQDKFVRGKKATEKEIQEQADRERKRAALARAVGTEPPGLARKIDMPEQPEIEISQTPQILSTTGQALGGLGQIDWEELAKMFGG